MINVDPVFSQPVSSAPIHIHYAHIDRLIAACHAKIPSGRGVRQVGPAEKASEFSFGNTDQMSVEFVVCKSLIKWGCMLLCITAFTACGTQNEPAPATSGNEPSASGDTVELSLGHIYSANHNEALALQELADNLDAASGGRIKLTIYPSSQLGSEREMAEMVSLGTLDMGLSDGPTWSNALNIPEMAVFGLPFLYSDIDGEAACYDTIIDSAAGFMEGSGVMPLFCTTASLRGTLLATKPINTLADISGIKIRVPEITMYVDTWKNMGANATTTSWSEAYTSISSGVVDGCEADPSTLVDANLQEVAKYYSETNHMGTVHIVSINQAKWDSIPEDLQQIIREECAKISASQVESRKVADAEAVQKMVDAGVVVNQVSAEERQKMIEAQQPLYDQYAEEYGLGELIATLQELGNS